jgi:hypothetical protein
MRKATKRPAAAARPPADERLDFDSLWARVHRQTWVTEEAARRYRRRSLLQDNPASG